ncbi:MAG: hypothetical protein M1830_009479 [Pleopsidium flavum]|nr:MAG: hypothetical protein M1830_009479 [Pleopsidium flavum]
MDKSYHSSVYVAPLRFAKRASQTLSKGSKDPRTSSAHAHQIDQTKLQGQMTPPLTPQGSQEALTPQLEQSQTVFHNYLRAFYPFHPASPVSSDTVTLPLNEGDIILVHSVHTNGWADGTLLVTGARGWLPTNYCEAYDYESIRNLLKALTNFWDLIRGGSNETLAVFGNQDYMRGLIAGVRLLLGTWLTQAIQESSGCLNRESLMVQSHDGIRRNRKALLSELSSLVKTAKRLQDLANGVHSNEMIENVFDEMVLKAFKVVTRGVKFVDVWTDDLGSTELCDNSSYAGDSIRGDSVPPTPPADITTFQHAGVHICNKRDPIPNITRQVRPSRNESDAGDLREQTGSRVSYNRASTPITQPGTSQSSRQIPSPASTRSKRVSISHRASCTGQSAALRSVNLASERLGAYHDAFLGFLGSFIGLHLQSRSSSELLSTTQQSVTSCRNLLAVVEAVWERDYRRSELLQEARDAMYVKITELVQAARDVFRPARSGEDDDIFMPDEGKTLVTAATACVRGAGECVAKTRFVIERIGDFDFEPIDLGNSTFAGVAFAPPLESGNAANADGRVLVSEKALPAPPEPANRPPPPPLLISEGKPLPIIPVLTPTSPLFPAPPRSTMENPMSTSHIPSLQSILPPLPHLASPLLFQEDSSPSSETSSITDGESKTCRGNDLRADSFGVASIGTNSTYLGSMRDSKVSIASQTSTRVTTPDVSSPQRLGPSSLGQCRSASQTTLAEECEETEAKVMEKTFAHELIYNKDGQIAGATLPALIERLTTHDSTPDAMFVSTFYLTFRLFASPVQFAEALVDRFEYVGETPNIAGPVRLRVYNIFKGWLESHWRHDCDNAALEMILDFAAQKLKAVLPTASKRLTELVVKVASVNGPLVPRLVSSIGKTNTSIAQYVAPDTPLPPPIVSKSQLGALRNWKQGGSSVSILDFDPLELARQFTIKESRIFCSILPEELLATEWMKKSGSVAVNVRAMSTLSTDLANLVADCILQLEDPKQRAKLIKQWIKIAKKCLELNNYDSLMAIICSLNSSTILRLKRTWDIVSAKTKATLENLRNIVDVSRNYAVLRQRLQNHVPPCLPFVGTYLTDLTFVDVGNQTTRQLPGDGPEGGISVINFDKHMKTAKIISELQRFQIPYRLTEVPELQTWMQDQLVRVRSSDQSNVHNYYRRSLLLEPRERAVTVRPSPAELQHSNMSAREVAKDKFDFLGWTSLSKEKSTAQAS